MTKALMAEKLNRRVGFDAPGEVNPDYPHDEGNVTSGWVRQFSLWAEYVHLRGGEAVMAGRLQGTHTQIIRVMASRKAHQIDQSWRACDLRTGAVYNIRDVSPDPAGNTYIDLLCETGVAT